MHLIGFTVIDPDPAGIKDGNTIVAAGKEDSSLLLVYFYSKPYNTLVEDR